MRSWTVAFLIPIVCHGQDVGRPGSKAGQSMVDVAMNVPRIVVELRYATDRNLVKSAIYPPNARCFVRQSVAERLNRVQDWLDKNAPKGTRLKIWDGWRPLRSSYAARRTDATGSKSIRRTASCWCRMWPAAAVRTV